MRRNGGRPYDGHLLLAVTRLRLQVNLATQLTELARETGRPLPSAGATAAGDPQRLRGIPCVGVGISGAIRDTRPGDSLERLDDLARRLGVLARDIDGTSPGTQPEEALLEAEAATLARLGHPPPLGPECAHESSRDFTNGTTPTDVGGTAARQREPSQAPRGARGAGA